MKKTVLVTGATSKIGEASAKGFAAHVYEVFAIYCSPAHRAERASIENVRPIQLDVTDPTQLSAAVEWVGQQMGGAGLYALIDNAGITYSARFEYAEEARAREVTEVNLMAPFRITRSNPASSTLPHGPD